VATFLGLLALNATTGPFGHGMFSVWWFWEILVALLFLAGWWRGRKHRQLVENTQRIEQLRALPWQDFENLVGEMFRREGYKVSERGGGGADGGVDLELHRNGRRTLVQCKRWQERVVKIQMVRELWGVVSHEGAQAAIFVTSGRYTADCLDFARGKDYRLITGEELLVLIENVEEGPKRGSPAGVVRPTVGPELPPSCPRCGSPMVRHAGVDGKPDFWGCLRFPACRGLVPVS